jgi:CheY-like chemotaxis protein
MATALTCFLIDDDDDDREVFIMALEDVDTVHKCVTAINGKDALQKLTENETFIPDFIFLDLNMPIMNGKQCLEEIKKIPKLFSVPVIIYTTSSYEKDINETKQLGAAHFLIKPYQISRLSKILSNLFQKQTLSFSLNEA